MIQINLLPPEYRARAGTPMARFVAIVVGVVLLASAGGAYAYTHFIELAKVKELKQARDEEARGKDAQRDRSLALQGEIDAYERRRAAIQTINRSRTLWSRKLDQFFDIATNQGTDDSYSVWLDSLEVPPQLAAAGRRTTPVLRKGAPQDGGQFKIAGFMAMQSESEAPAHSAAFFKALTGDPDNTGTPTTFFGDFLRINNPGMKIEAPHGGNDEELVPPVVGSFKYELTLRPLEAPVEKAAAPPPARPRRSAK